MEALPGTPTAPAFTTPAIRTQVRRAEADLDFYQQVWFHKLGADPATDIYSLGKDFPRIAGGRARTQ